jgi:hypothetical protein
MFPLFGCYELTALCLQHIVSNQQGLQLDPGRTHDLYENLLEVASKASALAQVTVPGTDVHVAAGEPCFDTMLGYTRNHMMFVHHGLFLMTKNIANKQLS